MSVQCRTFRDQSLRHLPSSEICVVVSGHITVDVNRVLFQVRAGYSEENHCFEIVTNIPYKRWDQVFISYGPHDNAKLLLEYGFILPDNSHNVVKIYRGKIDFRSDKPYTWLPLRRYYPTPVKVLCYPPPPTSTMCFPNLPPHLHGGSEVPGWSLWPNLWFILRTQKCGFPWDPPPPPPTALPVLSVWDKAPTAVPILRGTLLYCVYSFYSDQLRVVVFFQSLCSRRS